MPAIGGMGETNLFHIHYSLLCLIIVTCPHCLPVSTYAVLTIEVILPVDEAIPSERAVIDIVSVFNG